MQPGKLGVTADGRQGCAQFVTGVGREPAQPRLAGGPPGQGRLDMTEHAVERGGDLADLGSRVRIGHPLGQPRLSGGQRQFGHPGGGGGDPPQRTERDAHQAGAEHAGQDQDPGEHDQLGDLDVVQGGLHAGHRDAGDQHLVAGAGHRGQPVVTAQWGQVHGVGLPAGRQASQRGPFRRGEVALPVNQVVAGEDAILHADVEGVLGLPREGPAARAARAASARAASARAASARDAARGVTVVVVLARGGVDPGRGLKLVVELDEQEPADREVRGAAHHRAGHGEQDQQSGDEPAAQRAPRRPAPRRRSQAPGRPEACPAGRPGGECGRAAQRAGRHGRPVGEGPAALLIRSPASARTRPRAPCGSAGHGRRPPSCAGS